MKPKIIAMYLPQFHQIPENDEFWGEGFTDWVTVKNAKPLFEGHRQPRVPLNNNYYDLSLKDNVEWQCKLAHDYGIYGFGVYHYWFNNEKNLLTKPAEIMRDNEKIQTKYFLVWDNASWKRSWSNVEGNDWAPVVDNKSLNHEGHRILIPYILGEESDWRNHYDALKSHFFSQNYMKHGNKPVFSIFGYSNKILEMCESWNRWAKEDGFEGIFFIFRNSNKVPHNLFRYNYEPHTAGWINTNIINRGINKILMIFNLNHKMRIFKYNKIWQKILKDAGNCKDEKLFYGAFVSYDDTPRRGKMKSKIVKGETPHMFYRYFRQLLQIAEKQGKEYVFLTAWNEWGEGAYLEPDMDNSYSFLEALKKAIVE